MTDRRYSFNLFPEEQSFSSNPIPRSRHVGADAVDPISYHRERTNPHGRDAELQDAGARSRSSSHEERHPDLQHEPIQQATVIADLIHTLQTNDVNYDTAHIRNASAYSFEPIEGSEVYSEIYKTPARSTRSSVYSRYSSRAIRSEALLPDSPDAYRGDNANSALSIQPLNPTSQSFRSQRPNSVAPPVPELPPKNELSQEPPQPATYPPPAKLALILVSLYIAIFLVALDRTIIGPAIPEITNKFNSISDIGWYGSAYMLTSCGFILLYGRIYTFLPTKIVFLVSIVLFEIGSAVCGAASSSLILIIGRAIAGFGSSGIFTGVILIILEIVPLHRRPMLQGLFGACFGVASVAGPLLGGAFTGSKATWRWCFYINLPLGGFTIGVVFLLLHLPNTKPQPKNWKETVMRLDPLGTILFLPSITCLLLALEWGASDLPWSSPKIIALLTVFSALLLLFIAWQYYTRNTTATVPARILFQRSVAFGSLSQFAVGATMLTVSQYLPLWFQAIKGVSAMESGIRTIPLVLSVVVGSILSGGLVQRIGYYSPFMIVGSVLMGVGAGLLITWSEKTVSAMWIGYQVILGLGVGFTMQHPNLAIQVVLPKPDIPTGTALLSLFQTLGGAVFVAVGQNTFIDKFVEGLSGIPGVDPRKAVHAGATELKNIVPLALQPRVLNAYNNSLTRGPFFACMIVACLAVPAALGMEWRSVKEGMEPPAPKVAPPDEESKPALEGATEGAIDQNREESQGHVEEPPLSHFSTAQQKRQSYRMVGDFSWVLVKWMNPDLRQDLEMLRRSQ